VHRPLRVGQGATLTREIKSVERREGRTGPLVLVTIEIDITGPEGLALSETQTIAYTDAPPEVVSGPAEPILASPWQSEVATDSVLLFRFSAITFNSHRIHYDDLYARQEEGYPGLVVQGPPIALFLTELARNHGINARELRFRMVAPVIVGDVLRLRGTPTPKGADLVAHVSSGATEVRATVLGDAGTKSEFLRHINRA